MEQSAKAHPPETADDSAHSARPFFRIALMVEVSSAFGRFICQGVSCFAQDCHNWVLLPYRTGTELPVVRDWLRVNRVDGVISCVSSRELFMFLRETGMPLVNVLLRDKGHGITSVTADSAAAGRMAAEFFLKTGFWNFAFCGYPGFAFSDLRKRSFRDYLRGLGHTVHVPPGDDRPRLSRVKYELAYGAESDRQLVDWLCALPKPCAVLACNDVRGQQVIRLAQEIGINVPGELAVLGVDNDEVICNLCAPALSSIDPDCEGIGYAAAQMLDGLLRGTVPPGGERHVAPAGIVERQSTGITPVSDPVVAEALRIIRDRVRENFNTQKLCLELNCSRARLDNLFKKHLGCTSSEEITRLRLKRLTEVLQGTDLPLKEVARQFGFTSTVCLSQFISRESGTTPMGLRKRNKAAT